MSWWGWVAIYILAGAVWTSFFKLVVDYCGKDLGKCFNPSRWFFINCVMVWPFVVIVSLPHLVRLSRRQNADRSPDVLSAIEKINANNLCGDVVVFWGELRGTNGAWFRKVSLRNARPITPDEIIALAKQIQEQGQ